MLCFIVDLLLLKKKGIADEIVGLKASCGSIEASIETLEKIVKLKVNGQQRFNEDLAQIGVKHNSSIGGFSEKDMVDEVADVVASKISSSTLMRKPFLPERWLKANTTCNTKKSAKQTTLISKSDLKRNSHFKPRESCMVVESVSRKLYQTPSPKGTQAKCAKTSEKGQHSSSKDITELTMTSHKNTKSLGCIVPKLEAKFTCKPTYDMILAKRQPQVCAYLFQKISDAKLMAEILVVSGELEATRADLQCLIPPRVIRDLVITLAAKRITCIQVEQQQFTDRQAVWCLPPSFVFDFESGMQLIKIREKYCLHWMPTFPNLNFIYVPLKSVDGHWFLMIVHLKNEVIYHLDTYCPGGCAAYRHLYIKKVATFLHRLMVDPNYSKVFHNKDFGFHKYKIVEARGIPNTGNSDSSGVWMLHWLDMEQYFNPDFLVGTMKENEVRMTTAAKILLGDHNALCDEVIRKTETFINKMVDVKPIKLDED
ncbi:hypothetical protein TSUD_282970 [Trifolium subterraneum]|uniref:Ubiquitin-like protease family profile domain-containing protein n=1 Tax=Trifolium subterraneum TaxID=3900 RepID=A0A2Z6P4E2_TRISU|nr:hypothetical protein TSUD_282970 [Trifolium subterraneum]